MSLEFEFHLQFPCDSLPTELSNFHQSVQNEKECKFQQRLEDMCRGSTYQHFTSTFSTQIFKFRRHSCMLSFLFLPCHQSAPESLLAGYYTLKTIKHWPNFIDTDSNTFLRQMLITLLHLSLKACFMSLLVAGLRGFSTSPSFNFFGFGSFVILAIIEKSESECNREYWTYNQQTNIEA